MQRLILIYIIVSVVSAFTSIAQVKVIDLSDPAWIFRNQKDNDSYSAMVPGTIHTDLFGIGIIPDPFFGDNEKKIQWVEDETWVYECSFVVEPNDFSRRYVLLEFDGLDTYAEVFLNGKKLISADNMFRKWSARADGVVVNGTNELKIVFEPVTLKARELAKKLPYTLPGEDRVFVRKAQCHFGWDWGPRFVTCGVWKDARILFYDIADIDNVQTIQKNLNDSVAEIEAVVSLRDTAIIDVNFSIEVGDSMQNVNAEGIIRAGDISGVAKVILKDPVKWWCNGMGSQHQYNVNTKIFFGGTVISEKKTKLGIRTIELVQLPDNSGKSFFFRLNGVPVFIKGANYIPQDAFLPRVSEQKYQNIITTAADMNVNMLRVWGGGIYENDEFYDLCDSLGIMVWQDFMFACAMYPGESAFVSNVSEEIKYQVTRLRNHPSIALWCGNNEIDEGWKNWGWQKSFGYSSADSTIIYNDYLNLFEKVIPDIVSKNDSGRAYHPSSPATGWGRKESLLSGDVHYWGIWWGMEPFEMYRQKVGRFVSEYGFQGMPSMWTLKKVLPEGNTDLNSPEMKNHEKHTTGFETIRKYIEADYKVPAATEDFIYVSQLLQARGMEIAIEAHRKAMPYCMGSMFWQLNDCWPVVSWSCIDYYGRPKASFYSIKNAFAPVSLNFSKEGENIGIGIVSDKTSDYEAVLNLDLVDFNGKVLLSDRKKTTVKALSSEQIYLFDSRKLNKKGISATNCLLKAVLYVNDMERTAVNKFYYFEKPKDLVLKDPGISIDIISDSALYVKCRDYLAKNIYLFSEGIEFEDNFFDLLPGETKKVNYISNSGKKILVSDIKIRTLFDVK